MSAETHRRSRIIVCTYPAVPGAIRTYRPSHLISVLGPTDRMDWPTFANPARHLRLAFDDVQVPSREFTMPSREHIEALLKFLGQINPDETLLIHCKAGTSRSPAVALIAMALWAPGMEAEHTAELRRAISYARPHQAVIRMGDELLGAGGKLIEAVRAMPIPNIVSRSDIHELVLEGRRQ